MLLLILTADCSQEEGENIGLLQARVLAYVRAGLKHTSNVEAMVKDVNLALSLDPTNQRSIYRKAAVRMRLEVISITFKSEGITPG